MRPAARVQTAIDLLDQIVDGAPAERILTNWARSSRFAGSKDRAAVRDHVYEVLRKKNTCEKLGGGASGRALMIGLLRNQDVVLSEVFTGDAYAPEPLSAAEQALETNGNAIDLPDWVVPKLQAQFGSDFDAIEQAMKQRAPVILRANLNKTNRLSAIKALADEGIEGEEHSASETAIHVISGERKINNSNAYNSGLVELQDAASQAAIDMLPLDKCARVLDYCAGGGGKVLAMAGPANAKFFAHDVFEKRLRDIPTRAKRAGVSVKTLSSDQIAQQGPYDLVFCDVPCSGSGTWRRDPQGKWALSEDSFSKLLDLQQSILKDASKFLSSGGFLGFATCSFFAEENEQQVDRFLSANIGWKLIYQKRWSHLDKCDGFYTALLCKP